MAEELKPATVLKQYVESGKWGRPCKLEELKALSSEERTELGKLAIIAIRENWE